MNKNSILLLHAALGSKKQLEPIQELLANDFDVHMINFDGHGGKYCSTEFSIDLFTENALEYLHQNNITNTNIFGYSMGGYVGLNMAKKHADLVNKIVTLGTKFNWTKEAAEKEAKMLDPNAIIAKVPKFAEKLETIHHPNDWKEVLYKTTNMMIDLANGKRLSDIDLKQIKHKVLIGIGSLDNMVSIEESENAANQLPNAQLKVIDNFYHPIEKNDLDQLAKLIIGFTN